MTKLRLNKWDFFQVLFAIAVVYLAVNDNDGWAFLFFVFLIFINHTSRHEDAELRELEEEIREKNEDNEASENN